MDVRCVSWVCAIFGILEQPLCPDLGHADNLVKKYRFHGFPVVKDAEFIGYVTRDKLMMSIDSLFSQEPASSPTRRCTFSSQRLATGDDLEDLSYVVEEAVLQLRKEQPQELVVEMFQRLVSVLSIKSLYGTSSSCIARTVPSTNSIHT
jgi:hypothetical protein